MAGSLNHIVDFKTGEFTMDLIENLGDAHEALEECFTLLYDFTDGDMEVINSVCERLGYPQIGHNMILKDRDLKRAVRAGNDLFPYVWQDIEADYLPKEACTILNCSPKTLLNLVRKGLLKAYKIAPGGSRRITRESLQALRNSNT